MAAPQVQYADLHIDEQYNPESTRHGDVYFSRSEGIAESKYVFLEQNDFPSRWSRQKNWCVAETGFGTGLNFYLCAHSFLQQASSDCQLHFVSFEKYPIAPEQLAKILPEITKQFPELQALADSLLAQYPLPFAGLHRIQIHPQITLDLYFGDISDTLPDWQSNNYNCVDAWFLDGFAPSKNPDMWQSSLYMGVFNTLKASGTFSTFTATGHVRRGLKAAGLQVSKVKGFGNKREMLIGRKLTLGTANTPHSPHIVIVGGGIAAATLLYALKTYPGKITHIYDVLADGASGNPQAAIYPPLQAQWNTFSEFYLHAFLYAQRFYQPLQEQAIFWSGVHLKHRTPADRERQQKLLALYKNHPPVLSPSPLGIEIPRAGWAKPEQLVSSMIRDTHDYRAHQQLQTKVIEQSKVTQVHSHGRGVVISLNSQQEPVSAERIIFCTAHHQIPQHSFLPIRPVRGQVTQLQWKGTPSRLTELAEHVVCEKSYATPPHNGTFCVGATFDKSTSEAEVKDQDNLENIEQFNQMSGEQYQASDIKSCRASVRATTPDHLPIVGFTNNGKVGIFSGLGSRGFTSAPILAEALASEILGKPAPFGLRIQQRVSINRFERR
ncbi:MULTISPECIES: tRNA (5-methylaminomethyl-2-thiouridine)(34)-methyltransferase MnmD [Gammaproteobacteria]|uniref:tRNA (5-methylaminomethyl-2-thiouridine)(34)-methyltransferase MnmD n=1 Tax=Gammaproteobacteria TaxID=1236 RepID=UPI000DD06E62|nr:MULTISPECIES: tRNA (5-methylaminomethyl-2-thiouridine)(34)-methyltransferase MnmD [Gammaproteobacteria]RTE86858.1 FAD-dependent oxidoreductase [Aliidiomarina sp. B3213]TCZ93353.1 FAD-dependent oxidoreductase [Lysobacter sp. N42]